MQIGFLRIRERNFSDRIQARAEWVSKEASSDAFRWIWRDEDFAALARTIKKLRLAPDPVDSEFRAPFLWSPASASGDYEALKPGRMHGCSLLAAHAAIHDDEEAASRALALVKDFSLQCPYPKSLHWEHLEEVATRLVSLTWVRALLGHKTIEAHIGDTLLEQVYLHQRYLAQYLELEPYPDGRHLTAALAQFIAGLAFPGFPESARWRDEAAEFFEVQILAQTYEDGVSKEQNTAVETRTLELALLAARLAAQWEYPIHPALVKRVENMAEYFVATHMSKSPACLDGDPGAGRGYALPLGGNLRSRSLMAVAGVVFQRPEWGRVANELDPQSILMIGNLQSLDDFEEWTAETQVTRYLAKEAFPKGGRFFFRSHRGPSLVLGFDAASMGLEPYARGSHADNLGITIELAGQPLISDPGGILKDEGDGYQEYLRSTGAHSTLRVNWEDSAVAGVGNNWRKPTARRDLGYAITSSNRLVMAKASHEAYSKEGRKIVHTRMITRDSGDSYHLAIEDRIEAEDGLELEYELLFHLDPAVPSIQKQRDLYQVRLGESTLSLRFSSDNPIEVGATKGHVAPLLGWACRDGVTKQETWVLRVHGKDNTPVVIRTALFPG